MCERRQANLVEADLAEADLVEAELKVGSGEWKSFCRLRLASDNT
jgi:hypothetical protein